jgi:hypothetical protein
VGVESVKTLKIKAMAKVVRLGLPKMTDAEKYAMYLCLPKKQLARMLVESEKSMKHQDAYPFGAAEADYTVTSTFID